MIINAETGFGIVGLIVGFVLGYYLGYIIGREK